MRFVMHQGQEKILEERFGFAHHQKTMLVDQDVDGKRYLTAYMGKWFQERLSRLCIAEQC